MIAQPSGCFFHPPAATAVDDARTTGMRAADKGVQLFAGVFLFNDVVENIGPIETADKLVGGTQLQPVNYFLSRGGVSGCGQCDAGHPGENTGEDFQP